MGSNPAIAEQVNAEVVTKRETMTIGKIFSYIKQEHAKVKLNLYITKNSIYVSLIAERSLYAYTLLQDAFFECTATIDDVVHGSAWYYIACSGCHTKVTKGPTSMICTNSKCGKVNVSGVAQ